MNEKDLEKKYSYNRVELESIIENVPANVFFKDTSCRYQIASHVCQMLNTGGNPDFSIYGKTDLEIQPDPVLAKKFYEEDLKLVQEGGEIAYLQPMTFGDTTYYYQISKRAVPGQNGEVIGIIGLISDMTDQVNMQHELETFAMHDNLTGCFNRTYYIVRKQEILSKVAYPLSIVLADCDNLKVTNDTYGHKSGDYLLQSTVNNFRVSFPDDTTIIRMGGDEFMILIPNCDEGQCKNYMKTFQDRESVSKSGDVVMSTSLGYAVISSSEQTIDAAIGAADEMMYEVKKQRKAEKNS